ncbi:hypothetical protein CXG81DRAFT_12094 [Caulochytrium protostelioides]|uniref:PTR2-domain-containing protein n=1 Tax=Caulochytrium protostelioides TaxID=1555241 RepID=A0A4P9WWR6_9FUNG|nr:PTR2-domain-containing protein [Caulochytrium protostelioides]RKP01367.1 hypothetical protein CXG81DRAFT_12094 [Caulochytrium protostelioides]|eukprot:RKP01367.1 hypothetical protein CXG81DRAFT_12094 [Caulochytrium protostelioides]
MRYLSTRSSTSSFDAPPSAWTSAAALNSASTKPADLDPVVDPSRDDALQDEALTHDLPRVAGPIPVAGFFIVVVEAAERLAYYGASSTFFNLIAYPAQTAAQLAQVQAGTLALQPGAFDQGTAVANGLINFFTLACYLSPIGAAIVADHTWGKYRAVVIYSLVYLCGWILLTVSAVPSSHAADGTPVFGRAALPLFVLAILVIGFGAGIKSLISVMVADNVPREPYIHVRHNGQREVIDPDLTVSRVYVWFYWSINIGSVVGMLACTTLERSAFWKAYLVPACSMVVAIAVFVMGRRRYHAPATPDGSVIMNSVRCIAYAAQRRRRYRKQSIITSSGSQRECEQRVWPDRLVDDLKRTLKACSIFPIMIIYWLAYSQQTSNLISSAAQMERPVWLNNDVVPLLDPVLLCLLLPVFDRVIYPWLARRRIRFSPLRRMALGIALGGISMLSASAIQARVYHAPPYFNHPLVDSDGQPATGTPNHVSIWWQLIPYFLIACSEILASASALEFAYVASPDALKCLVAALALLPSAAASLINLVISPLARDPHLTIIYGVYGGLAITASCVFWVLFRHLDAEHAQMQHGATTTNSNKSSQVDLSIGISPDSDLSIS